MVRDYLCCTKAFPLSIACTNGQIRLVGGDFENEGTIEVCVQSLWSYITDVSWTGANARVICNQLGYSGGSKYLFRQSS